MGTTAISDATNPANGMKVNSDGSTNTSIANANANGQNTMFNSTPVAPASDWVGNFNLSKYNGSAVGLSNPVLTNDQIRALIAAGQGFRAILPIVATGGANALVGWQARAQSLGVNAVIYNVMAVVNNTMIDGRMYYNTTGANLDAGLTTNLLTSNTANQQVGGASPALSSLFGSPAGTTETSGMGGTGAAQVGLFGAVSNGYTQVLLAGSQIWLPKNTDRNVSMYGLIATSSNKMSYMIEWVEL